MQDVDVEGMDRQDRRYLETLIQSSEAARPEPRPWPRR